MTAAETKKNVPKPTKEKKPKASKPNAPSHPTYFQMVKEAISALKEKTGSSPYAIAKFMEEKYKTSLPPNYKKMLTVQLRNCVAKGKLVKVKGSFKLGGEEKKAKKTPVKTKVAKVKKNPKKKAAPAKAKQPKSIKSPVGKRARKASAT